MGEDAAAAARMDGEDFSGLDDQAFIALRRRVREEIRALPVQAARMLAVEILLAEPETLGDDVLETCLYLRDKLTAA